MNSSQHHISKNNEPGSIKTLVSAPPYSSDFFWLGTNKYNSRTKEWEEPTSPFQEQLSTDPEHPV
jgi:hypothetical protein